MACLCAYTRCARRQGYADVHDTGITLYNLGRLIEQRATGVLPARGASDRTTLRQGARLQPVNISVDKLPDECVAYPLDLGPSRSANGIGTRRKMANAKSAIAFRGETFGRGALGDQDGPDAGGTA